ncbi:MAG: adenine phosphoribosyltransferase, partial [Acidimicrobiales bacterium]
MTDASWLTGLVRDISDFPEPGITFRDITPLLGDVDAFRFVVDALADEFAGETIDRVLGIEARGFLLAAPVAYRLGAALVPVRKSGKLPHDTHTESYQLEYGSDALELHVDA